MRRRHALFFSLSHGAQASTLFNHPYLYKGPRSIAMGGAFVAVGGDTESLFYNPSGLHGLGFKFEALNPLMEADDDLVSLRREIEDALAGDTSSERTDAVTDLIIRNSGKVLHGRVSLFPNFAYENLAAGILAQALFDMRLNNPLSSEGAVEFKGGYEWGPVAGMSFGATDGLRAGVGFKYLSTVWVDRGFTVNQIATDGFDPLDYRKSGKDFSFDAGLEYEIPFFRDMKPKAGLSWLNITDIDMRENGRGRFVPATFNAGLSFSPGLLKGVETLFAVDFSDMTNAQSPDASLWKRLHAGVEAGVLERRLFLRAGLNQGYPTAGVELRFPFVSLLYAYYSEEMGAYAGQDKDTRHVLQISVGYMGL